MILKRPGQQLALYYIKYIIKNGLVIKEPESIVNNCNEYFANIGSNLAAKIVMVLVTRIKLISEIRLC